MNEWLVLRDFLGWCTLINFAIITVAALILMIGRLPLSRLHGKLFGLSEADISRAYFQYIAHYKIAVIVLNLVPYMALRVVL